MATSSEVKARDEPTTATSKMNPQEAREYRKQLYSVFVGHIHEDVTKSELYHLFTGCGEVVDYCLLGKDGKSIYQYGFIRYATSKELRNAVKELNGWTLRGVRLIVDVAKDCIARLKEEDAKDALPKRFCAMDPIPALKDTPSTRSCLDRIQNLSYVKEAAAQMNIDMPNNKNANKIMNLIDTIATVSSGSELVPVTDYRGGMAMKFVDDRTFFEMLEKMENEKGIENAHISKTFKENYEKMDQAIARILGSEVSKSPSTISIPDGNKPATLTPTSKNSFSDEQDSGVFSPPSDSSPPADSWLKSRHIKSEDRKDFVSVESKPASNSSSETVLNETTSDKKVMSASERRRLRKQDIVRSVSNRNFKCSTNSGNGSSDETLFDYIRKIKASEQNVESKKNLNNSDDIRVCGALPQPGELPVSEEVEKIESKDVYRSEYVRPERDGFLTDSDLDEEEQQWEVQKISQKRAEELFCKILDDGEQTPSPKSSISGHSNPRKTCPSESSSEDSCIVAKNQTKVISKTSTSCDGDKENVKKSCPTSNCLSPQEATTLTRSQKIALLLKNRTSGSSSEDSLVVAKKQTKFISKTSSSGDGNLENCKSSYPVSNSLSAQKAATLSRSQKIGLLMKNYTSESSSEDVVASKAASKTCSSSHGNVEILKKSDTTSNCVYPQENAPLSRSQKIALLLKNRAGK